MKTELLFLMAALPLAIPLVALLLRRARMERRAREILSQHPDAEQTSVYLAFRSGWVTGKQREMDAKIAEMRSSGWTFLRATEASPLRTLRSWGGGVTLHFIRC